MLTLDTSGIFAALNRADPHHKHAVSCLDGHIGHLYIPCAILAEIGYMLEQRLGTRVLMEFLADIETGAFMVDADHNFARIRHLVKRYADLPLGFSDATVIDCAERNGGRVLTYDDRDFSVVAKEGSIHVLLGNTVS